MCAPSCFRRLLVCHRRREHKTDPLRLLPAYADTACASGQMSDPCSHVPHHDDKQHAALSEPHHMTHWSHGRCDGAIPLLDWAFAQLPMPRADLPARLGDNLRVTRQRYEQRLVKGNDELISPWKKWQHLFLEQPGSIRESQPPSPLCSEYSTQVFRTMGKHSASPWMAGGEREQAPSRPCSPPCPALCPGMLRVPSALLCYTFL